MDRLGRRRRGWGAAGAVLSLGFLLATCTGGPAPVVSNNQSAQPPTQITVQHGQTLSGIAHAYHVPMQAVADANRLAPPYRIRVGQALIIPVGAEPEPSEPRLAMGEQAALAPAPYAASAPAGPTSPVSAEPIGPSRPVAAAPAKPPLVTQPPAALSPSGSAGSAANGPPRPSTSSERPPSSAERKSASAAPPAVPPKAPGPLAAAETPPERSHGGGSFLWPIRGHVVEGFGAGPDGAHNDGINIAAARGAAIEATDGGVVAYSGNELRGYGNLILIKHPGGWISAYAHCDLILVKTGQKVARGQVIARVGSTGNVSQPQLHFELRRGKKPVDPREYLAPLSTATAKESQPG